MPRPGTLVEAEITLQGGYFPSVPDLSPKNYQNTINAGSGVWVRPGGKIEVANGLLETSSTNVGARLFAADIQRATIAGGLVGDRLPYAGLIRYENACLFFLSEETNAQVYLNESAPTGLTTSSTAGRLRVAIPDGVGGYGTFDAGFAKPILPSGDVQIFSGLPGAPMVGAIGVAIAPWRSKTGAIGPISDIHYNDATGSGTSVIRINPPEAVTGQDGWVVGATRWGDRTGSVRVFRYVYLVPRGTFTATNGSPTLTGVGTKWTLDVRTDDQFFIAGVAYEVASVDSDTQITLDTNFTGTTGSGKTMTFAGGGTFSAAWYDSDLLGLLDRSVEPPPRAAAVLSYAGRVIVWGIADTDSSGASSEPTGNCLAAMLDGNPEHVSLLRIVTASKSDIVNVLAGDGPMYVMTTTSLEVISFTGNERDPYVIRVIAEPGFKAATNGCLYKDWWYGYSNKPMRTRAEDNIDVEFAEPVWEDMREWDGQRVIVAVDPDNDAILYMFDNGSTTVVIPYMAQLGVWSPPLNFDARIIDTAVVNGKLYITYLSGGNYRVNEWEGGSGIGGDRYAVTQFLDPNLLNSSRLKRLAVAGKLDSMSVYTVTPGVEIPDVTDLGAAVATFTLSGVNVREPEIQTNLAADAYAFRFNFGSNGNFQKLVAGGLPRGGRR